MADDAFASFERKWLDANPEQAAVLVFLRADQRRRAAAFGTLIHELTQTTFAVRETQVAAAKLAWWEQELHSASGGRARHPITIELFADDRVRAIEPAKWIAMVEGALSQLDESGAGDFAQLLDCFKRFYVPVAAIENEMSGAAGTSIDAVSTLWSCSHFLSAVTSESALAEHFALPLDLFARHGTTRGAEQGVQYQDVLCDFVGEVRDTLEAVLKEAPRASIGRRVRARSDRDLATKALRSGNPTDRLAQRSARPTLRHVWWAWREARITLPHT